MAMQEAFNFIKRNPTTTVFHIATVENGKPRVRPFAACAMVGETLYFFTLKGKDVYKQMVETPYVELCSYDPDTTTWLRLAGRLVWEDDPRIGMAMMKSMPEKAMKSLGGSVPTEMMSRFVYFRLEDAQARICAFHSEPEIIEY